jgi:hypothetical protein
MFSMDTSYSKDVQWPTLQLQHLSHNTGTDAQEVPQVGEAEAAEWSSQADFENQKEGQPPQGKEWSTRSRHAAFEAVFTFSESSHGAGDDYAWSLFFYGSCTLIFADPTACMQQRMMVAAILNLKGTVQAAIEGKVRSGVL